ncbi:MAG: hypothetical protein UT33_C0013G0022 [Candidatus Peregrinibacteria bacterium GW2011_GWC2_39_14]|nr:MAG: hypothetical protein US92_C0007G0074 [Candidatus Peregrinibacteria bacterium GW2011_GWA2_38_36]KKR05170.1 MAG: hypothetical protein UT33_C0013G0022 [Candidatus Peregrinibacteria bacterium GW2011_GWC2_39_14]
MCNHMTAIKGGAPAVDLRDIAKVRGLERPSTSLPQRHSRCDELQRGFGDRARALQSTAQPVARKTYPTRPQLSDAPVGSAAAGKLAATMRPPAEFETKRPVEEISPPIVEVDGEVAMPEAASAPTVTPSAVITTEVARNVVRRRSEGVKTAVADALEPVDMSENGRISSLLADINERARTLPSGDGPSKKHARKLLQTEGLRSLAEIIGMSVPGNVGDHRFHILAAARVKMGSDQFAIAKSLAFLSNPEKR